tara:strand:+ start:469 stop:2091 length:1623 start_codon:yes stop_codon:yes gene_type:complete
MADREDIKAAQQGISSVFRDTLKFVPQVLQNQMNNQARLEQTRMTIDAQKDSQAMTADMGMINNYFQFKNPMEGYEYISNFEPTTEQGQIAKNQMLAVAKVNKTLNENIDMLFIDYNALSANDVEGRLKIEKELKQKSFASEYAKNKVSNFFTNNAMSTYDRRKGMAELMNVDGILTPILSNPYVERLFKNSAMSDKDVMTSLNSKIVNELSQKLNEQDIARIINSLSDLQQSQLMTESFEQAEDTQVMISDLYKQLTALPGVAGNGSLNNEKKNDKSSSTLFSIPSFKKETPLLSNLAEQMANDMGQDFSKSTHTGIIKLANAIISGNFSLDNAIKEYNLPPDSGSELLKNAEKYIKIFKEGDSISETEVKNNLPDNNQLENELDTTSDGTLVTPDSSLISPDSLTTTPDDSLSLDNVPLDPTSNEIKENFQDPTQAGFDAMTEQGKEQIEAISEVVGDVADVTNIVNTPEYLKNLEDKKRLIQTGQYKKTGRGVSAFSTNIAVLVLNGMQQVARSLEPGEKLSSFNLKNFISQILEQK